MAQNIQSQPLTGAKGETGVGAGVDGILERAWHLLTSMRAAVILIFIAAGLSLLGTIIQQMPTAIALDAEARVAWLADNARFEYGDLAGPLDALGLFSIFGTFYFRAIVGLLCVSIIACTVHRFTGLWRTATRPRVDVGDAFFEHSPQRETIIVHRSASEALATVQQVVKKRRFRAVTVEDDVVHLYADRNRWGPIGSLAGHVAFLVIIAGAIISSTGFRVPSFPVTEGATLAVPNRPDLALRLNAYHETYDPATNIPIDFASDVTILQSGQEIAHQTIRVNQPFTYDGVSFFQSGRGNAVVLSVAGADGATVFSGGSPLEYSDNAGRAAGLISLGAASGNIAYAFTSAGGDDPLVTASQVLIRIYDSTSNTILAEQAIAPNTPTVVAGYTFTFERETKFSSFSVSRDPGAPIIWIGSTLLVGGFVWVFMFPHRRLWGRIVARPGGGSQIDLASIGRRESQVGIEFTHLVNDIRAAFHAPVKG